MEIELKPCPFCGWKAELENFGWSHCYVHCGNSNCAIHPMTKYFDTVEQAAKAWNRRAGEKEADHG